MSRVGILNFPGHLNHGANLTAYALQQVLCGWGHHVENVHLRCNYALYKDKKFTDFADAHIRMTSKSAAGVKSMQMFNADFDTFIVGSDQVWRCSDLEDSWMRPWENCYRLAFVEPGKRRIAMAASFGRDDFTENCAVREEFAMELQRYAAISVREQSGVRILASLGDFPVQRVIDPVFYLPVEHWDALADHQGRAVSANSMAYNSFFFSEYVKAYAADAGCHYDAYDLCSGSTKQWLAAIRDSQLVITDSYHVCCFCLIFGTPFVCLSSPSRGMARFEELSAVFGFSPNRIINVEQVEDVPSAVAKLASLPLEKENIDIAIERERQVALDWLRRALEAPVPEWSGPAFNKASEAEITAEIKQNYNFQKLGSLQRRICLLNILLQISPLFRKRLKRYKAKYEQMLNNFAW